MKKISFKEKNNNFVNFVVEQNNKNALSIYYELLMNCFSIQFNTYSLIQNDNINKDNIEFDINKRINLVNNLKFKKNFIALLKNYLVRFNFGLDKDFYSILDLIFIAFNIFEQIDKDIAISFINNYCINDKMNNKAFLLKFNELFLNNDLKVKKYINSLNINHFN